MNNQKSSSAPKIAGLVVLVLVVVGLLFFVLRTKQPESATSPMPPTPTAAAMVEWDRKIVVSGDAGTSFRCWLNREGTSEFSDRQAPATMEIPADVRSVEIRHTGGGGTLDLKVQNSKGPAMVSLMKSNDYADLFITKTAILWSQNTKTVSQLKR